MSTLVGFIRPPPDIRVVVDRTAKFIAEKGDELESKLKASSNDATKFEFLNSDNPYYGYYRHKVQEIREGKDKPPVTTSNVTAEIVSKSEEENVPVESKEATEKKEEDSRRRDVVKIQAPQNDVSKALKTFKEDMVPPKDVYTVLVPALAKESEIDLIKLTAQYTAVGGTKFLSDLTRKEQRNPKFAFLKPSHHLFVYFTGLLEAYGKVINRPQAEKEKLEKFASSQFSIIEAAVHTSEWNRREEQKKYESNNDKVVHQIDWTDFVVVETIDFTVEEEEDTEISPEAVVNDVKSHTSILNDEQINVRYDYNPGELAMKLQKSKERGSTISHFVDPISGLTVPAASATHHMKTELLDPKWKEDNLKYIQRQSGVAHVSGDIVSENLKNLAQKRTDIFGDRTADEERPNNGDEKRRRVE